MNMFFFIEKFSNLKSVDYPRVMQAGLGKDNLGVCEY